MRGWRARRRRTPALTDSRFACAHRRRVHTRQLPRRTSRWHERVAHFCLADFFLSEGRFALCRKKSDGGALSVNTSTFWRTFLARIGALFWRTFTISMDGMAHFLRFGALFVRRKSSMLTYTCSKSIDGTSAVCFCITGCRALQVFQHRMRRTSSGWRSYPALAAHLFPASHPLEQHRNALRTLLWVKSVRFQVNVLAEHA